jgi:hypothetical protein
VHHFARRPLAASLSLALGVLGLLGASALTANPAAAAVGPAITGTVSSPTANDPQAPTFTYTITSDTAYTAASVVIDVGTLLGVPDGSVVVDGVGQPSIIQSQSGVLTVPLPDGAANSTQTIAYRAGSVNSSSATTQTQAVLSFTDAGHPSGTTITAAPVQLIINVPDLAVSIPADFDLPSTLHLAPGDVVGLPVDVDNLAAGDPPSSLLLDLPSGLALEGGVLDSTSTTDSPTPCAAVTAVAGRVACPLGPVQLGTPHEVFILLKSTSGAVQNQTVTLAVSAQPTDPTVVDTAQANNALTQQIKYVGAPKLITSISVPPQKVVVGQSTTLTVTIRNVGAGPVDAGAGVLLLENAHFAMTRFDGKVLDPDELSGDEVDSGSGSSSALAQQASLVPPASRAGALSAEVTQGRRALAQAVTKQAVTKQAVTPQAAVGGTGEADDPSAQRLWDISGLAPGATMTAHLSITAKSAGTDALLLLALSSPADAECLAGVTGATSPPTTPCSGEVSLRAVAAPIAPTTVKAAAAEPLLPDTGARTGAPAALGLALLLMGALALRLGRRRA